MIINLGDAPFKAFITVTYPKGTCTVSDGTTTQSHSGGGTYTFTVKKKGTYTAKIQYSTAVKTANVSITSRGQVASVSLDYTLYLYNYGETDLSFSFGTDTFSNGSLQTNYIHLESTNKYFGTVSMSASPAIDLTPYTVAKIEIENTGTYATMTIGFGTSLGTYNAANWQYKGEVTKQTVSIDVSNLNGNYYLGAERITNSDSRAVGITKIHSVLLDV